VSGVTPELLRLTVVVGPEVLAGVLDDRVVRLALQLPPDRAVLGGSLSDVGQVRRVVVDVEVLSATLGEAE
jgi:hypothetical protein